MTILYRKLKILGSTTGLAWVLVAALAPGLAAAQSDTPQPALLRDDGLKLIYQFPADQDRITEGMALLVQAAEAGDTAALVQLTDLYLFEVAVPRDWARALTYAEAAAAKGEGAGLHSYGSALMWAQRDPVAAEAMLRRAAGMGVGQAWATLAEGAMYGYLGGGSASRAKFDAIAAEGTKAGVQRIAVLDATRHMWGISVPASGPETLAMLTEAADKGNAEAAGALIRLLRDGNSYNVRRDRNKAREAIDRYAALFSEREAGALRLSLDASEARSPGAWRSFTDNLLSNPLQLDKSLAQDLIDANDNIAMMVMQDRLDGAGFDPGPSDGFVGARTLDAMAKACPAVMPRSACRDSVMRKDVRAAIMAMP